MMRAGIVVSLLLLGLSTGASPAATTTAYINGYWFDGSHFSRRTACVIGEALSFHRRKRVDTTVDLQGSYVVPPFGEAHNHNVESLNDVPKLIATYLAYGIFYVKNPNNLPRDRATIAPQLNRPDSIDIVFSKRRMDQQRRTSHRDCQASSGSASMGRERRRGRVLLDRGYPRRCGAKVGRVPGTGASVREGLSALFR